MASTPAAASNSFTSPLEVATLFCTPEGELRLQNTFGVHESLHGLIATRVPNFYFLADPATADDTAAAPDITDSSTERSEGTVVAASKG